MNFDYIFNNNKEKPLENIVQDGGFCRIFQTIGCIGDSLASGEFQSIDENDNAEYHDMYEYSWGQYMAKTMGNTVYNFSKGGMTAKEYYETFADENNFWEKGKDCQCFIMALGLNDLRIYGDSIGDISDVDVHNYNNNKKTFAGYYAAIIQKIREKQPKVRFFLTTLPSHGDYYEPADRMSDVIRAMSKLFEFTYIIDLRKYGPVHDEKFKQKFWLGNHLNPMGYILTAQIMQSYIDYIVRHNMEDFLQVGFIGKGIYNKNAKW